MPGWSRVWSCRGGPSALGGPFDLGAPALLRGGLSQISQSSETLSLLHASCRPWQVTWSRSAPGTEWTVLCALGCRGARHVGEQPPRSPWRGRLWDGGANTRLPF